MERKLISSSGLSAASKLKASNISVNNNVRRSASKSPVRPKTPLGSDKNASHDSKAKAPNADTSGGGGGTSKAKSSANVAGTSAPARKSTASVPGTFQDHEASSFRQSFANQLIAKENGLTAVNRIANANARYEDATFTGPMTTVSRVTNISRQGSLGSTPGASVHLYRNNLSRTFPQRPVSIPGNIRNVTAKSAMGLNKSQGSSVFRASVEKAVRDHKVYTIVGAYPAIRNALKRRGWIEKNFSAHLAIKSQALNNKDSEPARGSEEESDQAWVVRVLKDYPPDFIWVIRRDNIEWRLLHKEQIINRYPKAFFTTKVGIAACLQNIHWYSEPGVAEILFPRCYRLCLDEEKQAFIEDYRITACFSILKIFVATYEQFGDIGFHDGNSKMTSMNIEFAIRQVNNYIRMRRHEDIDWIMPPALTTQHWEIFLASYYDIAQGRQKFNWKENQDSIKNKVEQVKRINQRAAIYWPQYNIDGSGSLWICKPGARSRGKGIIILSELSKIIELLTSTNFREANWVVQKYIERPLLIYKTKFDIRQWFIITDWTPLTIWFYKESYIRFCTKPFTLVDFHESVHLCNNAVQCRYQNSELRDQALPDENMWDCYTLQAYLNTIGKMDAWSKTIYPGMKQAIIGVLLASQEASENRKNCFELYGADFMLSEDLKPWLIEINSCPCMAASTSVTARLCASCLEDSIKVVLDRRDDKNCDTGYFELIYKQNISGLHTTLYGGNDLVLQGRKMNRDIDWPGIMTKYNSKRGTPLIGHLTPRVRTPNAHYEGMTFVDLVERLRLREDENQTTPHAQKSMETGQGSTFQTALMKYRLGQQTKISSGSANPFPSDNGTDNLQTGPGPTPLLDSGILKVKRLQTGPPDPIINYNGQSTNNNFMNGNVRPGPVSYSEMYPLLSNLTNRPENFVTFGNRAAQSRSVYGNVVNTSGSTGTGFQQTITNTNNTGNTNKDKSSTFPSAPLSLLTGFPTPVPATMADLLRMSRNSSNQDTGNQKSSLYEQLTGQQGKSKQITATPMMLVNPMKSKNMKIRPGQTTGSAHVSPMKIPNPASTISGRSPDVNTQKYAPEPQTSQRSSQEQSQSGRSNQPGKGNDQKPTHF